MAETESTITTERLCECRAVIVLDGTQVYEISKLNFNWAPLIGHLMLHFVVEAPI